MKDSQRFLSAEDRSDCLRMADGRGESDLLEVLFCNATQPLKADCELDTTPVTRKLVDFVDDYITHCFEMTLHYFSRKNRLEGFRGGDEDIWRDRCLFSPLGRRRIPVSHCHGEFGGCDETLDS